MDGEREEQRFSMVRFAEVDAVMAIAARALEQHFESARRQPEPPRWPALAPRLETNCPDCPLLRILRVNVGVDNRGNL